MPLDASLLALESELRSLRPLDMDFPTGQRVLHALEQEMPPPVPAFSVLPGAVRADTSSRRRSLLVPWAAAAALVAASWFALPHLPHSRSSQPSLASGIIPWAESNGEKAAIQLVFPTKQGVEIFGSPGRQNVDGDADRARALVFPEATSPYGFLGLHLFELSPQDCQHLGIAHGVGIKQTVPGAPASAQGLEAGDVIIRFNGAPVSSKDDLCTMIKASTPGSTATLKILRRRLVGELPVRLGSAPST